MDRFHASAIDSDKTGVENRRSRRIVVAITMASASLLAACGGSSGAAEGEVTQPTVSVEAPSTTSPDTTTSSPATTIEKNDSSTSVETTQNSPSTTEAQEQPNGEISPEKFQELLEAARDADGFPNSIVDIPANLSSGVVYMALLHNYAAAVNTFEQNPDVINAFLPSGTATDSETAQQAVSDLEKNRAIFSNIFLMSEPKVNFTFDIPEDINGVMVEDTGKSIDSRPILRASLPGFSGNRLGIRLHYLEDPSSGTINFRTVPIDVSYFIDTETDSARIFTISGEL